MCLGGQTLKVWVSPLRRELKWKPFRNSLFIYQESIQYDCL